MEEKVITHCPSCGAGLGENSKYCEYCGSLNPTYEQIQKSKQSSENNCEDTKVDTIGDVLGGIALAGALKRVGRELSKSITDIFHTHKR